MLVLFLTFSARLALNSSFQSKPQVPHNGKRRDDSHHVQDVPPTIDQVERKGKQCNGQRCVVIDQLQCRHGTDAHKQLRKNERPKLPVRQKERHVPVKKKARKIPVNERKKKDTGQKERIIPDSSAASAIGPNSRASLEFAEKIPSHL
jgi:hypothetical protein